MPGQQPDLEQLARRCTQGDKEALALLFHQLNDILFRFVFLKTNSIPLAKDICSETFITFWRYRSRYQPGNIKAFLYTIARNKVIDHFRKAQKHVHVEQIDAFEDNRNDDILLTLEKNEQLAQLSRAMKKLPETFAEVIQLRYIEGFSIKETADMLDMTSANVRTTAHRALKKLQELFDD